MGKPPHIKGTLHQCSFTAKKPGNLRSHLAAVHNIGVVWPNDTASSSKENGSNFYGALDPGNVRTLEPEDNIGLLLLADDALASGNATGPKRSRMSTIESEGDIPECQV